MRLESPSVFSAFLLLLLTLPANGADAAVNNLPTAGPSRVSIVEQNGTMTLMLNDQPFAVNGAGMGYSDERGVATLAAAGGNAFRTWDTDALDVQLAAAARYGLMVLVGLAVQGRVGSSLRWNVDDAADNIDREVGFSFTGGGSGLGSLCNRRRRCFSRFGE